MLTIPVSYKVVESVDAEYSRNLEWILDHDISELGLDLTFCTEAEVFGSVERVELIPGGQHISVTEDNKHAYVQLIAEQKMTKSIRPQIKAFVEGFHAFVPLNLLW